jgi:hypothetical protein
MLTREEDAGLSASGTIDRDFIISDER